MNLLKKKLKRTVVFGVSMVMLMGCSPSNTSMKVDNSTNSTNSINSNRFSNQKTSTLTEENEDVVFTVETRADLLRYYNEVSELVEDSNYVIEGNIKSKNSYVTNEGTVRTDYVLTVGDCILGDEIRTGYFIK